MIPPPKLRGDVYKKGVNVGVDTTLTMTKSDRELHYAIPSVNGQAALAPPVS
jgi:hypothetical protein